MFRKRSQRGEDPPDPVVGRRRLQQAVHDLRAARERARGGGLPEQILTLDLQRAQCFEKGGLEGPVDGHDLAGRLHLRADGAVGLGELVERPARDLDHAIVEGRLEGGGRFAGHLVDHFVEALADRDLGGHAGDRVARCLGRECRRSADARIDLDHRVFERIRVERVLDIAAALDLERPDDLERRGAEHLVLLV
jgi:hypothetical protein